MRNLTLCLLAALLVACGGAPPQPTTPPPAPVTPPPDTGVHRLLDATVGLVGSDGEPFCAGVHVSARLVATAAHCVEGLTQADVGWRSAWVAGPDAGHPESYGRFQRSYAYDVVHYDAHQDIAVLEWQGADTPPPHTSAEIRTSNVFTGQRVVAVGHPLGVGYTITEGIVSNPSWQVPREDDGDKEPPRFTQTSILIYFGNSGGPLVDLDGRVTGIASWIVRSAPWITGWVPRDVVARAVALAEASSHTRRR